MINLKERVQWVTTQTPGESTSITARLQIVGNVTVRENETEDQARDRAVQLIKEAMIDAAIGTKLLSPFGLQ